MIRAEKPQPSARPWLAVTALSAVLLFSAIAYWLTMIALHPSYIGSASVPFTLMRHLKVAVWALAVGVLLASLLLLFRRRRAAVAAVISLVVFGLVALWVSLAVYSSYFGDLPHLLQYQNLPYAVYLTDQIWNQLLGSIEYAIAISGALTAVAALLFLRWQRSVTMKFRRFFWRFAAVIVLSNLAVHAVQHLRFDPEEIRFGYFDLIEDHGLTWAYASMLVDVLNRPSIADAVHPGKINPPGVVGVRPPSPIEVGRKPNIIVIQVESLDASVLSLDVGEPGRSLAVTPFLRQLAKSSLYFKNFYAQHSGGGSSDAELAVLTGLLPLREEQGLRAENLAHLPSLPRILASKGYMTSAMHANFMGFFHRHEAYPRLGFQRLFDRNSYRGAAAGWRSLDQPFFKQSAEKLATLQQPFFSYLITMQSHGPFQNYNQATVLKMGFSPQMPKDQRDYLATMHEVDAAIDSFFVELDAKQILENSVIVLFGDHSSQAYYGKVGLEHVPLIISYAGVQPATIDKAATPLSLGNTILALIGQPIPDFGLGEDLLSAKPDRRAIFNDLNEARVINGELQLQQRAELQRFVEYSQAVLQ